MSRAALLNVQKNPQNHLAVLMHDVIAYADQIHRQLDGAGMPRGPPTPSWRGTGAEEEQLPARAGAVSVPQALTPYLVEEGHGYNAYAPEAGARTPLFLPGSRDSTPYTFGPSSLHEAGARTPLFLPGSQDPALYTPSAPAAADTFPSSPTRARSPPGTFSRTSSRFRADHLLRHTFTRTRP